MDKSKTPKMERCEDACVAVLQNIHPRMLGNRKVAITLADPYRAVAVSHNEGRKGVSETFCDELVRRALNNLVAEGRIVMKLNRCPGLTMKVFGISNL